MCAASISVRASSTRPTSASASISQNVQSQKDKLRTELEYQVALKAQVEIMSLHQKLDLLVQSSRERDAAEFTPAP